jgi:hypothetical protein
MRGKKVGPSHLSDKDRQPRLEDLSPTRQDLVQCFAEIGC